METIGARHRIRERVEQWRVTLEQLRAEGKRITGDARREYLARLRKLQATIAEEVQEWNATSYEYGADPDPATRKEFEEEFGLAEIRKQITEELAASQIESHDAG